MSPFTVPVNIGTNKQTDEQTFCTPDYLIFDPFDPNSLPSWHLDRSNGYQSLTSINKDGFGVNPENWG